MRTIVLIPQMSLKNESLQLSLEYCIQCGKSFNGPLGVRYHGNRVHFGLLAIICPLCDKVFANNNAHELHIAVSHGGAAGFENEFMKRYGRYAPPY